MKVCGKCGVEKSLDDFYVNNRASDKRMSHCKACQAAYENDPVNRKRRLKLQKKRRSSNLKDLSRTIISSSKKGAKQRDLVFELDHEWLYDKLVDGVCEVTGIPFVFDKSKHSHTVTTKLGRELNPWSPSIDRKDSTKGYTEDNCHVVCYIYNLAKQSFSDDAVEMFCRGFLANERD